jgi:deoxyribodipyrimidine photolyase
MHFIGALSMQVSMVSADKPVSIVWFQNDLRHANNPALVAAVREGYVLPLYIYHEAAPEKHQIGKASLVFLKQALYQLDISFAHQLQIYKAPPEVVFKRLIKRHKVTGVYWNQAETPWQKKENQKIQTLLDSFNIRYRVFNSNYLYDPASILKKDGIPYQRFSAYRQKVLSYPVAKPLKAPESIQVIASHGCSFEAVCDSIFSHASWHQKIEVC